MSSELLVGALSSCFLAILFLGILLFKERQRNAELSAQLSAKQPDATAQELLSEILAGPAVVKIEVIDRGSLLQWKG